MFLFTATSTPWSVDVVPRPHFDDKDTVPGWLWPTPAVIIKENARSIPAIKQPMTMLKNVRCLMTRS